MKTNSSIDYLSLLGWHFIGWSNCIRKNGKHENSAMLWVTDCCRKKKIQRGDSFSYLSSKHQSTKHSTAKGID